MAHESQSVSVRSQDKVFEVGEFMLVRFGVTAVVAVVLFAGVAEAARMPAIEAKDGNQPPACVTPGRLTALLKSRNSRVAGKFDKIAVEYMRHGEALGVRWDFAFFQMLVETGNLAYTGDVSAEQNNFAGIGATGGGEPGERFASVSDGVKAHLQHLQMYAGVRVDSPVAERTRKVQEWGILDRWRRRLRTAVTFDQMAQQWAPGSRGYARDIASVGANFMSGFCNEADPAPELVAEARGEAGRQVAEARVAADNDRPSGKDLARRAVERAREEKRATRSGLGAGGLAARNFAGNINVLNGKDAGQSAVETDQPSAQETPQTEAAQRAALVPPAAPGMSAPAQPKAGSSTCKVWTASYGGQKAVIIRADAGKLANYTVLDVNEGREGREVDAYIAAYAKGGKKIADFNSQTQALEKAFELCPEH